MSVSLATDLGRLKENVARAYRGDPRVIDLVLTALLARGHILIEDVPGVGKTVLARLHVRITTFRFSVFSFSIFLRSFGLMNGPFFNERDIFFPQY